MSGRPYDEACRVLVGNEWVVCGVSFEEACRCVNEAGARGAGWATPFGLPGTGPVLTPYGVVRAMVMLVTTQPFVIAELDHDDAARLRSASQGGETR